MLGSLFAAGGWYVGFQSGVLIQFNRGGTYCGRLVLSSLAMLPIAYWMYRRESKRELVKIDARTVCPKCDSGGEANDGATCQCGGAFISQREMKWVDES